MLFHHSSAADVGAYSTYHTGRLAMYYFRTYGVSIIGIINITVRPDILGDGWLVFLE